jgi:hypothetical protein
MVLEYIDPKNRNLDVNKNLRECSNETASYAALSCHMLCWSTSGIYATASGKVALRILCIIWTDIHLGKIKGTIVDYEINRKLELKTKPDETKKKSSTLTVFDFQWEPTECPIDSTLATYKCLGVHLDLHCKNNDVFDRQK